jgi:4-alpha-glucanotransferase
MKGSPPQLGNRSSGVLLHATSLPGASGYGDLGEGAFGFVDFLKSAGQSWWQMLPLNPIDSCNSPYASSSAFAAEPLLLDLEDFVRQGLLDRSDHDSPPWGPLSRAAFFAVREYREPRWRKAFARFQEKAKVGPLRDDVDRFLDENSYWINDYALFVAIQKKLEYRSWHEWPVPLRDRHPDALEEIRRELSDEIDYHVFLQYQFEQQWGRLREYCHEQGVGLIGDIPIYVGSESADLWAHRHQFIVDGEGRPTYVAAVPGDDFNPEGQRWDSPLYRWDLMAQDRYEWWMQRLELSFRRFDALRLDHFIGFYNYYQVPADRDSTVGIGWFPGPRHDFFNVLKERIPQALLIAEDLGVMNDGVEELRDVFHLPGMNVLQFSFFKHRTGAPDVRNEWSENSIVSTGTHDTPTVMGWLKEDVLPCQGETDAPLDYDYVASILALSASTDPETVEATHWKMVRTVMETAPHTAIIPMQDLLGLDNESRMNRPGFADGNWGWRLRADQMTSELAEQLRALTQSTERLVSGFTTDS